MFSSVLVLVVLKIFCGFTGTNVETLWSLITDVLVTAASNRSALLK